MEPGASSSASPPEHAWWTGPAAIVIAGTAAVLFGWNISRADFVPYYSGAARSMWESWPAFLFGSFDPAGSITLDKAPGFLWPQALSARLLGFHAASLVLPQVIEGVISVLVLFLAVRRWAGSAAGLLAAALFAFTPVIASTFGHAMEDGALTMCLILAADSWQRAVGAARLRPLLLAAAWVGAGFQAKMLASLVVLPAFAAVYLLAAPTTLRRRLGHLALAGLVTVAVSASWMVLVLLTPAADRPYVDGTTSNNVLGMVLGYNGVARFGPFALAGAIAPDFGPLPSVATSPLKLLDDHLATQVGWLYPLVVIAVLLVLRERRHRNRTDRLRAGLLMWALWLAVAATVYSAGTVLHTTYMAALAPPVAALAGAGIASLARGIRDGTGPAWALPGALAATLAWQGWLSSRYAGFLPWVVPGAMAAGALGLGLLAAARRAVPGRGRLVVVGLVCAGAAMTAAPTAWATSALDPLYDGSPLDASAGPSGIFDLVAPGVAAASRERLEGVPGGGASIAVGPPTPDQRDLLTYLETHRGGARYLLATRSVSLATLSIRETGAPVLLVGGFSGRTPHPTLPEFRRLVADGQVRYVVAPSAPAIASAGPPATTADRIAAWVGANCQPVRTGRAQTVAAGGVLYACG